MTTYGPNVPLPAVAITWLGPAAADPDQAPLTVLDALLTGGDSARLNQSLVYRQQIAQSVFSDSDARQQPGLFYVGAIMADGKTVKQGEQALLAEIAKLRDAPVGAAELDKAKTILIAQDLRQREPVYGRGFAFGYAHYVEGAVSKVNDDLKEIQAVTPPPTCSARGQEIPARQPARDLINYVSKKQRPEHRRRAASQAADARSADVAAPPLPVIAAVDEPAERHDPPPPRAAGHPAPAGRVRAHPFQRPARDRGPRWRPAAGHRPADHQGRRRGRSGGPGGPRRLHRLAAGTGCRKPRGPNRWRADIEALGAHIDANASWDGSRIDLEAVTVKLPAAMAILADVVRRPTFAPEELERLRQRTLDSLEVELQEPGNLARYAAADAVFAGTPYGHVIGGTPASLKRLTRADIAAFHQAWYRPDAATLVLTGDITPQDGFALAEQAAFGDWKAPAQPLAAIPAAEPQAKLRA